MSAHPVSFRRSVGTSEAPDCADMSDEMMERPRQQSSTASSNHSSSTIRHFDSLRLKDEILALAAHELREPLTPLRLATHMVRTAFADRLAKSRWTWSTFSPARARWLCFMPLTPNARRKHASDVPLAQFQQSRPPYRRTARLIASSMLSESRPCVSPGTTMQYPRYVHRRSGGPARSSSSRDSGFVCAICVVFQTGSDLTGGRDEPIITRLCSGHCGGTFRRDFFGGAFEVGTLASGIRIGVEAAANPCEDGQ